MKSAFYLIMAVINLAIAVHSPFSNASSMGQLIFNFIVGGGCLFIFLNPEKPHAE